VTLPADGEETTYDVRLKPEREGEQQWKLEVVPLPAHTTENNSKIDAIRIRDSRLTVLYVEGVPRWEYRKFKNFLVRGQDAFTAYSLLLGSTAIEEATALPGVAPLEDFPRTEEELRRFDVVIFGDVDPDAQDRLGTDPAERRKVFENVRRFTENGGGFMMLAGESFSPRAWKDTPIEDLLPVVVDPTEEAVGTRDLLSAWKPRLTALGRIHPIMQLDGDADADRKLWEEGETLKGFFWWSRVKKAKPVLRFCRNTRRSAPPKVARSLSSSRGRSARGRRSSSATTRRGVGSISTDRSTRTSGRATLSATSAACVSTRATSASA
jgi:hypothetical protein